MLNWGSSLWPCSSRTNGQLSSGGELGPVTVKSMAAYAPTEQGKGQLEVVSWTLVPFLPQTGEQQGRETLSDLAEGVTH